MKFLPFIYLGYMFISLYFLSFFLLLYLRNKHRLFDVPKTTKLYSISVIIPAFNEEATIKDTVMAVLKSDYNGLKQIIVVDDGSIDNTKKIAEELAKKYKKVIVYTKKNGGSKAGAVNHGLARTKTELVAVVDADSYPDPDAIRKLVGYFDNEKVGAATCPVFVRNRKKFIEILQSIEYKIIAFTRKLLDYVDSIYVTPGPLAVYRKSALDKIGGFDEKNMTEDIEATWHLAHEGYERRMCLNTRVSTTAPSRFVPWFKQRKRWVIGGTQCINKYKGMFMKKGMLGYFILPFFILQTFLGLVGLSIFIYLITKRILSTLFYTQYTITAGTALLTMEELHITPSVLNYLGVLLFIFGTLFTLVILRIIEEEKSKGFKKQKVFNILFYMIVYLSCYPIILICGLYDLATKRVTWR